MSLIDTKTDLLNDLNIDGEANFTSLDSMVAGETKFVRDLRMNVKNSINTDNLTLKEAYIIALSIAVNEKNESLIAGFEDLAKENGASAGEVAEAHAAASMLAVNNVFYRFRHYIEEGTYNSIPARLRMNIMLNPVMGKELFELVSLSVSAVNGCEACVRSHEKVLRETGVSEQKIFECVRLAAVIRGLSISL
ncbi:MAG: alkyl hydroperoxide reductase [Candidatus Kapaibacteriales bacterium]